MQQSDVRKDERATLILKWPVRVITSVGVPPDGILIHRRVLPSILLGCPNNMIAAIHIYLQVKEALSLFRVSPNNTAT